MSQFAIRCTDERGQIELSERQNFDLAKGVQGLNDRRRPLTIFLYRTAEDLGGALGLLDFNAERIQNLVYQGEADVQNFQAGPDNIVPPQPFRPEFAVDTAPADPGSETDVKEANPKRE